MRVNLLPDDYEPPEIKLEIRLTPYNGASDKGPLLKGYIKVSRSQVKKLQGVLAAKEEDCMFLQVALWDSGNEGGVDGVVEYKEYQGKLVSKPLPKEETDSIWF